MIARETLLHDSRMRQSRACGAISGLASGDSFGDAARKQENRVNYGFTTDFNSGASWSTDDTEFALLTAQILIDCQGNLNSDAVVEAWLRDVAVQDEFKRGGASEMTAAMNLRRGLRPPESGKFSTFHMSDGSAMRIAPVGIICAGDPEKAADMAKIDASVSHHGDGIWGAQAVAASVAVAMSDGTMDEIINAGMAYIPKDSWLYANMQAALGIVYEHKGDILGAWMPLHDALLASSWSTTAEAVPAAYACLKMCHDSFSKGVILAGNFGRDADTIGAIAGAILGAKYGLESIPPHWVEKTRYPSGTCLQFTKGVDLLEVGRKLASLIC